MALDLDDPLIQIKSPSVKRPLSAPATDASLSISHRVCLWLCRDMHDCSQAVYSERQILVG